MKAGQTLRKWQVWGWYSVEIVDVTKVVNSEVTFSILFISFLIFAGKQVKKTIETMSAESREREKYILKVYEQHNESHNKREAHLLEQLEKNTEHLGSVAQTMQGIQNNLVRLEEKMDSNFSSVWRELRNKQDREG